MDDFEQPSATNEEKSHLLLLPYQGQKGDFALKWRRKRLKTLLPNNFNTQIAFKGKKLNSCFKIKDTDNFQHKHDLVYHRKYPAKNCNDDRVGEIGQRISEKSHLLKYQNNNKNIRKKNINVFKIKTLLFLAMVFRII